MNIVQLNDLLKDKEIVSPIEDCTQLGIVINLIKIKGQKTIIYGGGLMGEITVRYLKTYGVDVEYIIDADPAKTGSHIEGVEIISLDDAAKRIIRAEDHISFIALSRELYDKFHTEIEKYLSDLGVQYYYFEDIWKRAFRSYWIRNPMQYEDDFKCIYNLLSDTESQNTWMEFIRCSVKNDSWLLPEHMCIYKYWGCDMDGKDDLYQHLDNEIWLNCGSCIGDTIFNYLGRGYHYETIYAVEGDSAHFVKLQENIGLLEDYGGGIELINQYIGDAEGQLCMDDFFQNRRVTLMNADIEGKEMEVLKAARGVIIHQKPVIAFCVYHHFEDTITFINYLREIQSDYHFYLRKYVSGVYNRFMNEVVLYAVPTNRLMQK